MRPATSFTLHAIFAAVLAAVAASSAAAAGPAYLKLGGVEGEADRPTEEVAFTYNKISF